MSPFQTFMCGAGGAALITGAWAFIKWIAERHAKKKDDNKMTTEDRIANLEQNTEILLVGVRSLLYANIKEQAKEAIAYGSISTDDLEDLTRKHELYHNSLNGNGYLDAIMSKVKALPIHE